MSHSWSVVITTRNRAGMLKRAIDSCLRQTLPCEIVVVDEASADSTPEVVQSVPEIKYIRNEQPVGHSAAANLGIRAASGSWIKPLDDDDWLAEDCIERMEKGIAAAEKAGLNPVFVSALTTNVDADEHKIGQTRSISSQPVALRSKDLLMLMMQDRAPIGTPVQVGHRKDVALSVGGWNEERKFTHQHGDEVEFWIKVVAAGDTVFLPESLSFRTMWPGGSQDRLTPEVRFQSNVYLKDLIAKQLGIETPGSVKSYLALHWALIAAKRKEFGQFVRLGLYWMRRPDSVLNFFTRSGENPLALWRWILSGDCPGHLWGGFFFGAWLGFTAA